MSPSGRLSAGTRDATIGRPNHAVSMSLVRAQAREGRRDDFARDSHQFEVIAGVPANSVTERWRASLERHLRCCLDTSAGFELTIAFVSLASFRSRIRSGVIGPLHYCQYEADARKSNIVGLARPGSGRQLAVVQLSGTSLVSAGGRAERLRPGQMLLLNEIEAIRVEDDGRVEQLLLMLRLPDAGGQLPSGLTRLQPDDALGALSLSWIRDSCLSALDLPPSLAEDIGHMLSGLLAEALARHRPSKAQSPGAAMDVQAIEAYVEHYLEDPCLSPRRIAQAFGCSVRTLHRAFSRPGKPSLCRYLWQRRVETCAELLRAPSAASRSLTEIALDRGFSSAAHFSTLFRDVFGITPSEYRRRAHQPPRHAMVPPMLPQGAWMTT